MTKKDWVDMWKAIQKIEDDVPISLNNTHDSIKLIKGHVQAKLVTYNMQLRPLSRMRKRENTKAS